MSELAAAAPMPLVVFSVLYNESAEFLDSLIANFLAFTGPNVVLVVNVAQGRADIAPGPRHEQRVHVIHGQAVRSKFGHTLLIGHLEAFAFAEAAVADFAYFCTLASNSLLVRPFDLRAAQAALTVPPSRGSHPLDALPDVWWWREVKQNPELLDYMRQVWRLERLCHADIEGFFASRADWRLLHASRTDIMHQGRLVREGHSFPFEEILPATVILHSGSGRFTNICHVFWNRIETSGGKVTADDLVFPAPDLAPQICALKWFDRTPLAPETLAVTTKWGIDLLTLLRAVASRPADAHTGGTPAARMLTEQMAATLRGRETSEAVNLHWRGQDEVARPLAAAIEIVADHQLVRLAVGIDGIDEQDPAYLFLEATGRHLRLHVAITGGGGDAAGEVTIACVGLSGEAEEAAEPALQGYLYLRPLVRPDASTTVRVSSPEPVGRAQHRALETICFAVDGHYRLCRASHVTQVAGRREHYYLPLAGGEGMPASSLHIGIPFFTGSSFRGRVEVVRGGVAGPAASAA